MGRVALNLHRMKRFQGQQNYPSVVEVRPILREKTPNRPAARLLAADSALAKPPTAVEAAKT